jgi:hypothetical protein
MSVLVNEYREELKRELEGWLREWKWNPSELWPFEDVSLFEVAFEDKVRSMGLVYDGWMVYGEMLVLGVYIPSDEVQIHINVNPVTNNNEDAFRVAFRTI